MGLEYDRACSFEELYKAMMKCRRNVMWKDSVAGYVKNGLVNILKLEASLKDGSYRLDPYDKFYVNEPKRREIFSTRFKDRVFQRSLCDNILYPQITRGFIYDNCACQTGKGVDFALGRMKCHLQRHYRKHGTDGYVCLIDVRNYFGSTPHTVAKAAIDRRVKDPEAAGRARQIVDSFGENGVGIGLGSQVSQLMELAVLDDIDHFIKETLRVRHYVRYMDDLVLVLPEMDSARACLTDIRQRIEALGFEMNRKTRIVPLRCGFPFLKWRFRLSETGRVYMTMDKRNIARERRKLRKFKILCDAGAIGREDVENNLQSWRANALRGDAAGVIRGMESYRNRLFSQEVRA